jgi:hypothetical protein
LYWLFAQFSKKHSDFRGYKAFEEGSVLIICGQHLLRAGTKRGILRRTEKARLLSNMIYAPAHNKISLFIHISQKTVTKEVTKLI